MREETPWQVRGHNSRRARRGVSPVGDAVAEPTIKPDAPFYTEEELDALYEHDPVAALRLSREQHALQQQLAAVGRADGPPPTPEDVKEILTEARRILLRDGGDLEFVALEGTVVRVRLKGNCVGCPRAVLDLRNVVERMVRNRFPQVTSVQNVF